jgi:hypothetical protein
MFSGQNCAVKATLEAISNNAKVTSPVKQPQTIPETVAR